MRRALLWRYFLSGSVLTFLVAVIPAQASPWAQVGEAQLRSDIEVLAAAGVIDNITTQWPLPWGGILYRLDQPGALNGQPAYVVSAAERVRERGMAETEPHRLHASATVDATNNPDVVRGFDAMGLQDVQGQANLEYQWESTVVHIAVGAQTTSQNHLISSAAVNTIPGSRRTDHRDRQILLLDGSYIAQRIGNTVVFAGFLPQWWGPGWISALSVSNNSRPFPQAGIMRIDTTPFSSPWLHWIGPWQFEFAVGLLDGPRIATNTLWDGVHFSFSPLSGLEIGLNRTQELCGTGHPCKPSTYFNLKDSNSHLSSAANEGNIDLRYTGSLGGQLFSIYTQLMNEDSNAGNPFTHSASSHIFGLTTWVPVHATRVRLTAEYTDSISTRDAFSFGNDLYGVTYHDFKYPDGNTYRGRTLGFSLDVDSRLASLQASWIGPHSVTYTLTYHHAAIGSPQSAGTNIVTTSPVTINIGEARIQVPFSWGKLDVEGRLQDDRPRPEKGFKAAIETALTVYL